MQEVSCWLLGKDCSVELAGFLVSELLLFYDKNDYANAPQCYAYTYIAPCAFYITFCSRLGAMLLIFLWQPFYFFLLLFILFCILFYFIYLFIYFLIFYFLFFFKFFYKIFLHISKTNVEHVGYCLSNSHARRQTDVLFILCI